MEDPVVAAFFEERKEDWLKKNVNTSMETWEVKEKEVECGTRFSLEEWLPNAAKRAGQISISTHPCTFSHPSARKNKNGYVSSIISTSNKNNDGFLRSGNVDVSTDALGNAAALDVYKFLSLVTEDGKNILSHLQQDSDLAKAVFTIKSQDYGTLKDSFLAMTKSDSDSVTSSKIKQVYFPVGGDYHLLSILVPSGIMFDLRERLDNLRFGDEMKLVRDKKRKGEYSEQGYSEIYGLTTIGYGGTKPQNISVLNNQNGGKTHLLMSMPPILTKRDNQIPNSDFFKQSINYYQYSDLFIHLHNVYMKDTNNMHVRTARDELYKAIFDKIVEKMWLIRSIAQSQFNPQYSQLKHNQKIWLLDQYQLQRDSEDAWLETIILGITQFVVHGYEKILAKKAIKFGADEYKHMTNIIEENKEVLR